MRSGAEIFIYEWGNIFPSVTPSYWLMFVHWQISTLFLKTGSRFSIYFCLPLLRNGLKYSLFRMMKPSGGNRVAVFIKIIIWTGSTGVNKINYFPPARGQGSNRRPLPNSLRWLRVLHSTRQNRNWGVFPPAVRIPSSRFSTRQG